MPRVVASAGRVHRTLERARARADAGSGRSRSVIAAADGPTRGRAPRAVAPARDVVPPASSSRRPRFSSSSSCNAAVGPPGFALGGLPLAVTTPARARDGVMANAEDDPVSVLRGIVGLSREACAAMLSRAGGDVAAAVNRHFAAHDPRGDVSTVAASPKRPPSASARSKSTKRGRRESSDLPVSAQRSLLGFLRAEPETRDAEACRGGDDDVTREAVVRPTDVAPSAPAPSVPTLALHTTRAVSTDASPDTTDPWPLPANVASDDRAPYALVAHLLDRLGSTSKRLDKADALATAFSPRPSPRTERPPPGRLPHTRARRERARRRRTRRGPRRRRRRRRRGHGRVSSDASWTSPNASATSATPPRDWRRDR